MQNALKEVEVIQPSETKDGQALEYLPLTVEGLMARAIDRGDTETMQQLFAMRREMRTESAQMLFNAAMSKAQSEMKQVAANMTNPQTRSKYADYGALDKMLRPVYTGHGFALSFDTGQGSDLSPVPAEHVRVWLHLSHEGGFSKPFHVDMPADGKGAKGADVMTKTHATGAATAYGMRYLLKMVWNVAIGEEDKDGNEVGPTINEKQLADLRALAEETNSDIPAFCAYFKIDQIENLPASLYSNAVKAFEKKRRAVDKKGATNGTKK